MSEGTQDATAPLTVETMAGKILDRVFPKEGKNTEGEAQQPAKAAEAAQPETPQAEPKEGEEQGEQPKEGEEAQGEEKPTPKKYRVTVDGADEEVTEDELLKGYSRQKHFTQSMQKLADERKAFEADRTTRTQEDDKARAEVGTKRTELEGQLSAVAEVLQALLPQEPDWAALRKEYSKEDVDAAYVQWTEQRGRIQRVFEQRDKIGAERQEELRKAAVKFEEEQRGKLLEAVPEWKDPEKLSAGLRDLTAEARKIGFSDQELSSVVDHRLLLVLRDAVAYRKLQAAKPKVENRITEVVTPVAPGAAGTQSAPKTELTKAKERVRQTGSIDDMAAAVKHMLK